MPYASIIRHLIPLPTNNSTQYTTARCVALLCEKTMQKSNGAHLPKSPLCRNFYLSLHPRLHLHSRTKLKQKQTLNFNGLLLILLLSEHKYQRAAEQPSYQQCTSYRLPPQNSTNNESCKLLVCPCGPDMCKHVINDDSCLRRSCSQHPSNPTIITAAKTNPLWHHG